MAIISTIFHETVHYGDWTADGVPAADNSETYYNADGSILGYSNEVGDAFESEVYHNGDFWEQQDAKWKTGSKGLNNMRKRIENKSKTNEGKKDLPSIKALGYNAATTQFIENAIAAGASFSVTY